MSDGRRFSFRLRLALQTVLVAGVVIATFGAGAWWFAMEEQARNLDLRIAQKARQLWAHLTPRLQGAEFRQAVQEAFAEGEAPLAAWVVWHSEGNPSLSIHGPALAGGNHSALIAQLPSGPSVVTQLPESGPQRPGRAQLPGQANVGTPRRPLMPEIKLPFFFTVLTPDCDWRIGAFSNPHYTLFVGFSREDLQAGARRAGFWLGATGGLALLVAGAAAWWTAGRAIRPLSRIAAIANRMGSGSLGDRIPLDGRDDREFAQLIESLNQMTLRLLDSFERAARFTADASHELKTPLAVMQSTLNEALRYGALEEDARERINVVLHQVSRLKQITHSLLLLSQADAGELPLHRDRYDLSNDLEGLMEDAESLCETAALAFEKHIEPGVFVEADRAIMHQVFQNLVSNSVKHNMPGGRVRVRLSQDASNVRFEVANTSVKIPEEVRRRLFDRFFRAEDSRSGDGFGLGLNIAFELARANGARLELMTAESGMICFSVTMARPPLRA